MAGFLEDDHYDDLDDLVLGINTVSLTSAALGGPRHKRFGNERLHMVSLPSYSIPDIVRKIECNEEVSQEMKCFFTDLMKMKSHFRSHETLYYKAVEMMVFFEEVAQTLFLEKFNTTGIQLFRMENREDDGSDDQMFYFPITEKMTDICAAIDENHLDRFKLKAKNYSTKEIAGQIKYVYDKKIFVEIDKECVAIAAALPSVIRYDVSFELNLLPFQVQHYAMSYMKSHGLFSHLINNSQYDTAKPHASSLNLNDNNVEDTVLFRSLNSEQQSAVKNILKQSSYPLPFVLFGPPGTGKTKTLVASIEQIVKTTTKYVLVCAMSNAACDEITERLLDVLEADNIYRLYSKSYNKRNVNKRITPICNFKGSEFVFPPLSHLYGFRVLICTLCTSSLLVRAREDTFTFDEKHFSYVFIDECASAHETLSMVPIAGLCTSDNKVNASVVVAGDPKQLDAVTRSKRAIDLGFKTSFLEHLCDRNLYRRDPNTDKYNENYIAQLLKNYRSHPLILNISNSFFYDNKLQAKAAIDNINWFVDSTFLPSSRFPIIFRDVQGVSQRSETDFSLSNEVEVRVVMDYVKKLLNVRFKNRNVSQLKESDIGIVTPYKRQCKRIAQVCRREKFNDILIGTAETFQGKEKPVIIVSTVRSDERTLGFVNEPRRLNVIMSRAKCLLIIVGNRSTLSLDPVFKNLIKYCSDNNSLVTRVQPPQMCFWLK